MLSDLSHKILIEAKKFSPKELYKAPEIEGYDHDQVVDEINFLVQEGYLDALPLHNQSSSEPIDFQSIKITREGLDFLDTPTGQSNQKQKILILAAIPLNLRLDKETRAIENAIRRADKRDLFDIRIRTAVCPQDIRRAIAEERPQIVHFCGHGNKDGSLVLEDEGGNNKPVSPEALVSLFQLHVDYVKCVLLNACYSEKPAIAISQYIDYVIGMNNPINDRGAIEFSRGFYDGLGYEIPSEQDVFQRAFDEAMVAIKMENNFQDKIPVLKKKIEQEQLREIEAVTVDTRGIITNRLKKEVKYFQEDLGNDVILEMVSIPGGEFMMGTEDEEIERLLRKLYTINPKLTVPRTEKPQHRVAIKPFYMGKYQVTQAQWKAVAALDKVNHDLKSDPSESKGDNLPVEMISWDDAVEFCHRLSQHTGKQYRLPSESEWEYACRAGTDTPFYFGKTITGELANYRGGETFANEIKGKYRKKTTPVGKFSPNAFGLYNMHGNVWEWCQDTWHDNYNNAPTDGSPWIDNSIYHVLRGGSFDSIPEYCRSASRISSHSKVTKENFRNFRLYGFRVVCS